MKTIARTGKWPGGSALLPVEVQEWAGLTNGRPKIVNGHSLSDWNDGQNRSFSEIADMIEASL